MTEQSHNLCDKVHDYPWRGEAIFVSTSTFVRHGLHYDVAG